MEPEPFARPVQDMLPVLVLGAAALVVAFVILALARLWGWRTQHRGGSCGGIDLDDLRRQRMAGEISQEEYEAVRASIAGAGGEKADATGEKAGNPPDAPRAEPDAESSIETHDADPPDTDTTDDAPERSRTDGET